MTEWLTPLVSACATPGGSEVKKLSASAEDKGGMGLIPGSGRPPGGGKGHHSSVLACRIPRTEDPGG